MAFLRIQASGHADFEYIIAERTEITDDIDIALALVIDGNLVVERELVDVVEW